MNSVQLYSLSIGKSFKDVDLEKKSEKENALRENAYDEIMSLNLNKMITHSMNILQKLIKNEKLNEHDSINMLKLGGTVSICLGLVFIVIGLIQYVFKLF